MANPFPEDPKAYELDFEPEWDTIIVDMGGAVEQRRSRREFAVYNVRIKFDREMVNKTQMQALWAHFMSCAGAYQGFYVYDYLVPMTHTGQLCAIGNGSSSLFDLPGRGTSTRSVYVDGVKDAAATYLTGGGNASSDRVQLSFAPSAGAIVTADFYGYLRAYCRYEKDNLSRGTFFDYAFDFGIKLKGLMFPV